MTLQQDMKGYHQWQPQGRLLRADAKGCCLGDALRDVVQDNAKGSPIPQAMLFRGCAKGCQLGQRERLTSITRVLLLLGQLNTMCATEPLDMEACAVLLQQ